MNLILAHYYNNLPQNRKAIGFAEYCSQFKWATFTREEWKCFAEVLEKMVEESNKKYPNTKTYYLSKLDMGFTTGPHIAIHVTNSEKTLSMGFEFLGESFSQININKHNN